MVGKKRKLEYQHISEKPIQVLGELENARLEKLYVVNQQQEKQGFGTRQREALDNPQLKIQNESRNKLPKKKVALLFSYNGTGYNGMQITPTAPSIELDLHKAFAASGAVSEDNAMSPAKVGFVRCARTDKGVHAAGQVVSLKMILKDGIIDAINSKLPPQIRVWGYCRTNNKFHAQKLCDSRIYEYLLPTYILMDCDPKLYPFSKIGTDSGATLDRKLFDPVEQAPLTEQQIKTMNNYRISSEKLASLKNMLNLYKGTHKFHNFTQGKTYNDRSCSRFIISFECGEPFIQNGTEWLSCKVTGQSFMIHQIRKMIGLVIMMIRTGTSASLFDHVFTDIQLNIPKAPSLGLLLEQPLFTSYNKGKDEKLSFEDYKDQILEFKNEWIYNEIFKKNEQDGDFMNWIRLVDQLPDLYAWYLQPDGSLNNSIKPSHFHHAKKEEIDDEQNDEDEN